MSNTTPVLKNSFYTIRGGFICGETAMREAVNCAVSHGPLGRNERSSSFGWALAAIAMTLPLTACGSKTEASEKNFREPLAQTVRSSELCLSSIAWPRDVTEFERKLMAGTLVGRDFERLDALEAVGLVKSELVEQDVRSPVDGKPGFRKVMVTRYTLSDAAKPFARERKIVGELKGGPELKHIDLCWAQRSLERITKWEQRKSNSGPQEVVVFFTYKIEGVADWARNERIQAVYPAVKETLEGNRQWQASLRLSPQGKGWQVNKF